MFSQIEIKETLYSSLKALGLTNHEIELYTTSLSLGPVSISQLAKQLNINRPNIYKIISELENHGLAKFSERKKHNRTFMVESPTLVRELLAKKRESLSEQDVKLYSALPDLLTLYRQGELPTSVKIFEGKDQFLKIFFEVLDESKNEIIYCGSVQDLISGFIGWAQEEKWIAQRLKKQIFMKALIFGGSDAEKLKLDDAKQKRETRYIKNMQNFPTSFHLYANKIIIWQPKTPLALLIEDEYIVTMFRSIFQVLWEQNK
ncbi:MAG: helix-turn-helix domain-containing protein [Candidatus Magasanikbacteria bacterium]|jgi:sugar-specific transcriptional regulator TrmB